MRAVTAREIALARPLFWLRGLPARLAGRSAQVMRADAPALAALQDFGFLLLYDAEREIGLGLCGRFWDWRRGGDIVPIADAAAFTAFRDPGGVKAAIDFMVEEVEGGVRVSTETRVLPLGPQAARRFRVYWCLIRPWSGLLRRTWLAAIRRRATRRA